MIFIISFRQILYLVLLILLTGLSTAAVCQKKMDTTMHITEEGWIEKMTNSPTVKLALTNDIETFFVDTESDDLDLRPNTSTLIRAQVNYRILSIGYSFAPQFFPGNEPDSIKGKTESTRFGFGLNFKRLFTALSYRHGKGYYIKNTKDYQPTWIEGDPYLLSPELVSDIFQGETAFKFNRKFSQPSLISQTERQLKSAGSFIPTVLYRYYIVDNKAKGITRKSNNFQFSVGPGYYHTFVIKSRFYFSAGLTPSFGFIYSHLLTRYTSGNVVKKKTSPVISFEGRSGVGYNGRRFFTGAYVTFSSSIYTQRGTTAVNKNTRLTSQLFLGYRFNAPKGLRNTYDSVSDKLMKKVKN